MPSIGFDDFYPSLTEKDSGASPEAGSPATKLYCVDENIERRNHYLDLAGIENYTSKFDNTGTETTLLLADNTT